MYFRPVFHLSAPFELSGSNGGYNSSNGNKALVGRSLYIDRDVRALFSGFCIRARILSDELDPKFFAYFTRTNLFKKSLSSASGTNISNLNQGILADVLIPRFDPERQRAIADLLASIDGKISVNQRLCVCLERLAKMIYDYWFVQFDFPSDESQTGSMGSRAIAGKPYRASGGPMVYNDNLKREIPESWSDGSLVDIASFTNGIACQKYRPEVGAPSLPVIKIREMRSGFTAATEAVTIDVPDKIKITNGDVLFSWSASLEVVIWTGGEGALNQHIFKVTSDAYPRSFYYFALLNYLQHFRMIANSRKTTMGHITSDHLKRSRIVVPGHAVAQAFDVVARPLMERLVKAHAESQHLMKLRDWLLPMLMNGQVSVS